MKTGGPYTQDPALEPLAEQTCQTSSRSADALVALSPGQTVFFLVTGFRATGKGGLAVTRAPSGTYIAYATRPGDVAVDGEGENSPFTAALARALPTAGASLEQVFKQVRADVRHRTDGEQIPWTSSSIEGEFYFHKAVAAPDRSAARERALQGELAEARRRLDEAQQKARQAEASAASGASADKAARDKRIEELQIALASAETRAERAQEDVERFKIMPRAPGGKSYVVEDLPAKVWQVGDVTDLRSAPGEAGRKIRKVAMLTKVTLTGRTKDGNWLRVRLPSGEEGFLPAWTVTDPNATTARAARHPGRRSAPAL